MKVKCPKCGSEVECRPSGRMLKGFCVVCGREVWACPECGYASFSYRGVAGHMKTHQLDYREIIRDPARLSEIINLDNQLIINGLKALSSSSLDNLLGNQQIINLLLLAALVGLACELETLSARLDELAKAVNSLRLPSTEALPRAPPATVSPTPPETDESLPSFVRGNPWLSVLSGVKKRGNESP